MIHFFDHLAVFSFKGDNSEAVLEALLSADVDVNDVEGNREPLPFLPAKEFYKVKSALAEAFPAIAIEVEEITFIPQSRAQLTPEDVPLFEKFMNMLNDCDDVQDVYHNATLPS